MESREDRSTKRDRDNGEISQLCAIAMESCSKLGLSTSFTDVEIEQSRHALQSASQILQCFKVVYVEDNRDYLEAYVPLLQVVTGGRANFIHVQDQNQEDLVGQIESLRPDLLLMDYFLRDVDSDSPLEGQSYNGSQIVSSIRQSRVWGAQVVVIGFSADGMFEQFAQAGANGATTKYDPVSLEVQNSLGFSPPHLSVESVARVVDDLQKRSTPPAQSFSLVSIVEEGRSKEWFEQNARFRDNIQNYRIPRQPGLMEE